MEKIIKDKKKCLPYLQDFPKLYIRNYGVNICYSISSFESDLNGILPKM